MQYPKPGIFYLYHLFCKKDFHYIGITKDYRRRIIDHCERAGADVTKKYPPRKIFRIYRLGEMDYPTAQDYENKYTLWAMKKYGNRVRGGIYCHINEDVPDILRCNIVPRFPLEQIQQINISPKLEARISHKPNTPSSKERKKLALQRKKKREQRMKLLSPENAANLLYDYWQETNPNRNWNDAYDYVIRKNLYLH